MVGRGSLGGKGRAQRMVQALGLQETDLREVWFWDPELGPGDRCARPVLTSGGHLINCSRTSLPFLSSAPKDLQKVSAPIPSVPPPASPSHLSSNPHSFKTPDPRPKTRGCTCLSGLWTLFHCLGNLSHSSWPSPWEVGFPLGRHHGRPMMKALCWKGGCLQSKEDYKHIKCTPLSPAAIPAERS